MKKYFGIMTLVIATMLVSLTMTPVFLNNQDVVKACDCGDDGARAGNTLYCDASYIYTERELELLIKTVLVTKDVIDILYQNGLNKEDLNFDEMKVMHREVEEGAVVVENCDIISIPVYENSLLTRENAKGIIGRWNGISFTDVHSFEGTEITDGSVITVANNDGETTFSMANTNDPVGDVGGAMIGLAIPIGASGSNVGDGCIAACLSAMGWPAAGCLLACMGESTMACIACWTAWGFALGYCVGVCGGSGNSSSASTSASITYVSTEVITLNAYAAETGQLVETSTQQVSEYN